MTDTYLPTLGDLDLWESSYSGFTYPQTAQVVPVLAVSGTIGGNAVLQSGGLPWRQARLTATGPEADVAEIRGYYESREEVPFVDRFGVTRTVRVLEFSQDVILGDLWAYSLTLLEVTPPAVGS